jgi:gluconate 2-dehydrogenase alpha chain
MATNLKPVDVVVVGLGAAGGVAVLPLCRAGLKVAALEAGSWMQPGDFKADEIHNNVRRLVTTGRKVWNEIPTFRTSPDQRARQGTTPTMMNAVGGTSIHYYANSWRFQPWDFKVRSETVKRYGAGALPKGTTVEDWPLSYDDLEHYYDLIEYEIGVSGKAGNIRGKIDPAGNIFEGFRTREYPMPPLRDTDFTDMMQAAAKKAGFHPHRSPAAINSQPRDGRSPCAYHGYSPAYSRTTTAKPLVFNICGMARSSSSPPKLCWLPLTRTKTSGSYCFRNPRRFPTVWPIIMDR